MNGMSQPPHQPGPVDRPVGQPVSQPLPTRRPPTPGPHPTAPLAPVTPAPAERPAGRRRLGLVAGVAAAALLFGGVGGYTGAQLADNSEQSASAGSDAVEGIAAKALPSVVTIKVSSSSGVPLGTGSGFVLRSDGYIVTNNHVATAGGSSEDKVSVLFSDETEIAAKVVGTSPTYDLAVLKVDRAGLPALELADSSLLKVGQSVIAVGAPLGLTGSVTTGIVSALNRPVVTGEDSSGSSSGSSGQSYMNAIQTDASINRGNSGGPLLDLSGRVVGVNSAIYSSKDGGSIGLGFAIPADQVRRTTDQLIRTGKAEYPVIGLDFDPNYTGTGVKVERVSDGGPAKNAGLQQGDVITSIDGVPTKDPKTFLVTLRSKEIGAVITVGFERDGAKKSVTMQTAAGS